MAVVVGVIVIGFIGLNPNPAFVGPTPEPTSPALGIVIAVDSAGLANVRGFTLRDSDSGSAFTFKLGPLDNATEFSPSHLSEHLASSEPIRVFFRLENGELVAHRIEDASGGLSRRAVHFTYSPEVHCAARRPAASRGGPRRPAGPT